MLDFCPSQIKCTRLKGTIYSFIPTPCKIVLVLQSGNSKMNHSCHQLKVVYEVAEKNIFGENLTNVFD